MNKTYWARYKTVELNGILMKEFRAKRILALQDEIIRLNEHERMKVEDIAASLGVNSMTLRGYIQVLGIKIINTNPWHKTNTTGWDKKILIMLANEETYETMAKKLNTNESAICRWVCNQGLSKQKIQ
jgi:hypothetical protein